MFCLIAALCFTSQSAAPAQPMLSPVFGSHMVLQRDRPNAFWGWASPGTRVTVKIGDRRATATADKGGKWLARVSPPPTGGPYTVNVDGPEHIQLDDVLVGDVWICSGQSNMEMGIAGVNNAPAEIAAANYPGIRLYMVQKTTALTPMAMPTGSWSICSPETVAAGGWGGFSAVGYFFGRDLHQQLKVPIGLVETSWGGTVAEAWTSRRGLAPFKEFQPAFTAIDQLLGGNDETMAQKLDRWMRENDPGSTRGDDWAAPSYDDIGWKPVDPATFEAAGLEKFDGVVWFRKDFTLPDPVPAGAATLQLGTVDDMDSTWINGVKVGESYSYNDKRQYQVATSVLKPGHNVLTVRVVDTGGPGGLATPASLLLRLGDGAEIRLDGGWRCKAGVELSKAKPLPVSFNGDPNMATVLYNGMIAPLLPMAIKGAIWYQGESNAGRAKQYQSLLPAMIGDWRKSFGQGDFPFFVVQLANFATRHPDPVEDAWAELREAQALTVKKVRNTGLAVAIDIGDRADIHPKNKQDVGHRLALSALSVAYGVNIISSGPEFRSARREGGTMRIKFAHADGGLAAHGDKLAGFQIAGTDRKFVWADARIDGDSVVVSAASVTEPVAVRYAWDTDPEAALYNGAGLPAIPFRTDK